MEISIRETPAESLTRLREERRRELDCQIIHDSISGRPGWAKSYFLEADAVPVGFGSMAIAGPWKDKPTLFEFHVVPGFRHRAFAAFELLLATCGAVAIECQSNDPLLATMQQVYARGIEVEAILFRDGIATALPAPAGGEFRAATAADIPALGAGGLDCAAKWVVTAGGDIAAAGGILFHYNPPYGDLYMRVADRFRTRGFGAYLVQEMKRECRGQGKVPAARCNRTNLASRATLQKAGFVPCGVMAAGPVR